MSLVFDISREVSVGSTLGFQGNDVIVSSSTEAYVSKHRLSSSSSSASSSNEEMKDLQQNRSMISCFSVDQDLSSSLSDSSSIDGLDDDSDDDQSRSTVENGEENENEVRSKFKGSLCSMESLEDSLPIKRGLSNFFTGKSKSFANLSEATTLRSLAKTENPFNKRRRTLIACKWNRRNFYSSVNPVSMPLLELNEDEDQQETDSDNEIENNYNNKIKDDDSDNSYISDHHHEKKKKKKIKSFKPTRCFSLTDIHQHPNPNIKI